MSQFESISQEKRKFEVPKNYPREFAHIRDFEFFQKLYTKSLKDPETYWAQEAENFYWFKKWNRVLEYNWGEQIDIKWFQGAQTNLSYNCLDRHLKEKKDQTALLWVGNKIGEEKRISYGSLHEEVCKFANVLKNLNVKKGDRVALYMPMIPELAIAVLACARIGAIHSVVFGGFSAEALKDRILDSQCKILITADGAYRGNKTIPLKETVDEALQLCAVKDFHVSACIVVRRTGQNIAMQDQRDFDWQELMSHSHSDCPAEALEAEDPLFILYTSGSTGKPKGVLHTTAGYMVYTATTFKNVFDYHENDLYWCTADIGWVTGHSYIVYGPLLNGAQSLMFEGIPTYPNPDRFWEIIERYQVNQFYTAPTALRALMREGNDWVTKHDLSSLKVLGSVGEPINPEAWIWYFETVGQKRCPIVDTWWQTETGGILISPLPGATPCKPGSATLPLFGIEAAVINEKGEPCAPNEGGYLVIKKPWPGMMRTVYGDHQRFKETYFSQFPGMYFTGDEARKDEDGYFWIMGRMDDVINVSGHRMGTAEIESALVSHPLIAEAAVVGYPHEIKGQGIYAYVTLIAGDFDQEALLPQIKDHVRKEIGAIAIPDQIQFSPSLPKTRSGKIMRRILRKIASGDTENLGDTSTLADPNVVQDLIQGSLT